MESAKSQTKIKWNEMRKFFRGRGRNDIET